MTARRQTLSLLSPCFCRGGNCTDGFPELRVPSVRGHLRFWARVLAHNPKDADAPARFEHNLFGGVRAKDLGFQHPSDRTKLEALASRFVVGLRQRDNGNPHSHKTCPHDPGKGSRIALPAGTVFDITWEKSISAGIGKEAELLRVMKAWVLLGSVGLRANRAAGSVWRYNWEPSESDFLKEVKSLWPEKRIPNHLTVKVLRLLTPAELAAWKPPGKLGFQGDPVETLRAIATDTLAFGHDHEGAFGFGGNEGRKGSPTKLKIGRFSDGFRLIAIVDMRNQRHGKLADAVEELFQRGKPLGVLLKHAGFCQS